MFFVLLTKMSSIIENINILNIQSHEILGTIISKLICNFLFRDVSTKSSSVGVLSRYSTKFDIIKNTMVKKQTKETARTKNSIIINLTH